MERRPISKPGKNSPEPKQPGRIERGGYQPSTKPVDSPKPPSGGSGLNQPKKP
jgi:hypothetical protein